MKLVKFALKTAAALTALAALALLLLVGYLWLKSPGEAQPITDVDGVVVPGSISAIETVMLGGIEQRMIVRGRNADAPVMLFLHGGPGARNIRSFAKPISASKTVLSWFTGISAAPACRIHPTFPKTA